MEGRDRQADAKHGGRSRLFICLSGFTNRNYYWTRVALNNSSCELDKSAAAPQAQTQKQQKPLFFLKQSVHCLWAWISFSKNRNQSDPSLRPYGRGWGVGEVGVEVCLSDSGCFMAYKQQQQHKQPVWPSKTNTTNVTHGGFVSSPRAPKYERVGHYDANKKQIFLGCVSP